MKGVNASHGMGLHQAAPGGAAPFVQRKIIPSANAGSFMPLGDALCKTLAARGGTSPK